MAVRSMIDMLPQTTSPPQSVPDTGLYGPPAESTVTGPSQFPLSEGLRVAMDPNLPLDPGWADWNMDDSGGGFVPDMAYWIPFEQHF